MLIYLTLCTIIILKPCSTHPWITSPVDSLSDNNSIAQTKTKRDINAILNPSNGPNYSEILRNGVKDGDQRDLEAVDDDVEETEPIITIWEFPTERRAFVGDDEIFIISKEDYENSHETVEPLNVFIHHPHKQYTLHKYTGDEKRFPAFREKNKRVNDNKVEGPEEAVDDSLDVSVTHSELIQDKRNIIEKRQLKFNIHDGISPGLRKNRPRRMWGIREFLQWLLSHMDATDENVTGENVTGENVTGENVTGEDVTNENVTGENVTGEDITGENVTGENVTGEDVTGENVTGEDVTGENVTGENVTGEDVTDENVTGENVTGENVTGENVTDEDVTSEDVTGENVTGEDVTGENVTGEDVTGENVTGEDVTGENVTGEDVTGENVTGENVTGEDVTDENVTGENVTGENVTGEDVTGENVTGENVTGENVTGENVTGEDVTGENVTGEDATIESDTVSRRKINLQPVNPDLIKILVDEFSYKRGKRYIDSESDIRNL